MKNKKEVQLSDNYCNKMQQLELQPVFFQEDNDYNAPHFDILKILDINQHFVRLITKTKCSNFKISGYIMYIIKNN